MFVEPKKLVDNLHGFWAELIKVNVLSDFKMSECHHYNYLFRLHNINSFLNFNKNDSILCYYFVMYMSWACLMMSSKTFIRKYYNLPHTDLKRVTINQFNTCKWLCKLTSQDKLLNKINNSLNTLYCIYHSPKSRAL